MTIELTYVFAANEIIEAAQLNQNFIDLRAALDNLSAANLNQNAGIESRQLADRFSVRSETITLLMPADGNNLENDGQFSMPINQKLWHQYRVVLREGQESSLVAITVHVAQHTINTAVASRFEFRLNNVVLGGAALVLEDGLFKLYPLGTPSPFDVPLASIKDGDIISVIVDATSLADQPFARGISMSYVFKDELIP